MYCCITWTKCKLRTSLLSQPQQPAHELEGSSASKAIYALSTVVAVQLRVVLPVALEKQAEPLLGVGPSAACARREDARRLLRPARLRRPVPMHPVTRSQAALPV